MKTIRPYIVTLLLILPTLVSAQMRWNSAYQTYFNQYKDLAIEQMFKYGIPASITLAQGVFESGAGKSELARKGNNHFGIKCHGWQGATTYHDDDAKQECFRAYDNVYDSYEDHSKFLRNNARYRRLFSLSTTDYRGWAKGLKECGYATNPAYARKLTDIIELYKLNQYDRATSYDKFMAKHNAKDRPAQRGGTLHPIKMYNKNYYLVARKGDTFKSIGKEVDISWRAIAKRQERHPAGGRHRLSEEEAEAGTQAVQEAPAHRQDRREHVLHCPVLRHAAEKPLQEEPSHTRLPDQGG